MELYVALFGIFQVSVNMLSYFYKLKNEKEGEKNECWQHLLPFWSDLTDIKSALYLFWYLHFTVNFPSYYIDFLEEEVSGNDPTGHYRSRPQQSPWKCKSGPCTRCLQPKSTGPQESKISTLSLSQHFFNILGAQLIMQRNRGKQ